MVKTYSTLSGAKGGGKAASSNFASSPSEAPNTLASVNTARIIDVLGEGPIEGLVNGLKSVYLDDTSIQNDDNSYNFSDVKIYEAVGTPDQDHIPGFPGTESEVSVGAELLQNFPITGTITDANVNAVRVKIRMPAMTRQTIDGSIHPHYVEHSIEVKPDGGSFTEYMRPRVDGKTVSPYERSYRINLPAGGAPWEIRVTRINQDSSFSSRFNNRSYWSTYTQIIDNKLQYPDTALIGVEANARQFNGQIPARAYEIKGLKIKIPSNYNPTTRAYTGIWDGTFTTAYSNNPAWVMYDLMTSKRYGIGDAIDASEIDKFALYEIAQYCDELVDDGNGGQEPRYTFNGIINTREEAYRVLNSIASNFRGMLYWSSGLVTATIDKDEDPVMLVTPANVVDGMLNYESSSAKTRHSVAIVRWNDPEDAYRSSVVGYEDPELIEQYGWKPKDVVAYGCTSKAQAYRQGKWVIDTEKTSTEVLNYRASFDNASLAPGDIIEVADPDYAGARYGGRIVSATTTAITIDAGIEIDALETYTITVVQPDGNLETATVTNSAGTHTELTLDSALAQTPNSGAMWIVSSSAAAPRKFRVISVVEDSTHLFSITALYHDPNKYARIESDIDLVEDSYTTLPTGPLAAPTDLQFEEYLYSAAGGIVQSAVTVSWTPPEDARVTAYEIQMQFPDNDFFTALDIVQDVSLDVPNTETGVYEFRVRSMDNLGRKSAWRTESVELFSADNPPADVTGFTINNVGENALLQWDANTELDLSHYVIKFTTETASPEWGGGTTLVPKIPGNTTSTIVPSLIGTYMIKAVDTSDVESVNSTNVISNITDIDQNNVVTTVTESPTFSGTKTDVNVVSSTLRLTDPTAEAVGTYEFATTPDFGAKFKARIVPSLDVVGEDVDNTMSTWIPLASASPLAPSTPATWSVDIQVRTTDDDPLGSPTWSAWTNLIIGEYSARAFQFRAILTSANGITTPVISGLAVTIDVEDRIERGEDVVSEADGSDTITFASEFYSKPIIQINAQGMASDDTYTFSSVSKSGFSINFYNSSGVGVQRTYDWSAQGIGKKDT